MISMSIFFHRLPASAIGRIMHRAVSQQFLRFLLAGSPTAAPVCTVTLPATQTLQFNRLNPKTSNSLEFAG
jgi:hypothetical protein